MTSLFFVLFILMIIVHYLEKLIEKDSMKWMEAEKRKAERKRLVEAKTVRETKREND